MSHLFSPAPRLATIRPPGSVLGAFSRVLLGLLVVPLGVLFEVVGERVSNASWVALSICFVLSAGFAICATDLAAFIFGPAIAWLRFWAGKRYHIGPNWILNLERGSRGVLHQEISPFLNRAGPRGSPLLALRNLAFALDRGELPEISEIVIPYGFARARTLERIGFDPRPCHEHWFVVWFSFVSSFRECRRRSKKSGGRHYRRYFSPEFRFEGVLSREDFILRFAPKSAAVYYQ